MKATILVTAAGGPGAVNMRPVDGVLGVGVTEEAAALVDAGEARVLPPPLRTSPPRTCTAAGAGRALGLGRLG